MALPDSAPCDESAVTLRLCSGFNSQSLYGIRSVFWFWVNPHGRMDGFMATPEYENNICFHGQKWVA